MAKKKVFLKISFIYKQFKIKFLGFYIFKKWKRNNDEKGK